MKTTRLLSVKLTREELEDRAKNLAKFNRDKTEAELQKKNVTAQIAATIKECEAGIDKMAQAINTGIEYRDVPCTLDFDYEKGKKYLYRDDTLEQIDTKALTEDERQQRIPA